MAIQLKSLKYVFVVVIVFLMVMVMMIDYVQCDEREECTTQLTGLSTCLAYVGGTAKAPTLDCCSGMKEVFVKSKKCLCLLIKNRNDPTLGLKINATLALNLPSICRADVTIADCPALLHLPPNSEDAKVFQQFEKGLHKSPPTPADSRTANSTNTAGSGAQGNKCLELKIISQVSLGLLALLLLLG